MTWLSPENLELRYNDSKLTTWNIYVLKTKSRLHKVNRLLYTVSDYDFNVSRFRQLKPGPKVLTVQNFTNRFHRQSLLSLVTLLSRIGNYC